MQYKELLKKYIDHVISCDARHTDFVAANYAADGWSVASRKGSGWTRDEDRTYGYRPVSFTDEEWSELQALEREGRDV